MAVTLITFTTPPCLVCAETSALEVDVVAYDNWVNGMLVQQAFPELSASERELIKSGIHDTCWQTLG